MKGSILPIAARTATVWKLLTSSLMTLGFVIPAPLQAQGTSNREVYTATAVQVEKGPRIDGVLDDEIWQSALILDQFTQQEPQEGQPASERTEVLILYDARNLYIGLRAFDSDPDGIIATEMRRDSARLLEEDSFQIIVDTFNDYRSGYMFVTNPLGARLEQQISEEGEGFGRGLTSNINRDWNGVWHVAHTEMNRAGRRKLSFPPPPFASSKRMSNPGASTSCAISDARTNSCSGLLSPRGTA